MSLIEIVALVLLLVGNLLVLRWLIATDPVDELEAAEAEGLARTRTEPTRFRRAA